jgi:hypothetical protein
MSVKVTSLTNKLEKLKMTEENETIVRTETGVRISVDSWDDGGAYLHFITRHGSLGVPMNRQEAQKILAGLQAALNSFTQEPAHV